MPHPGARAVFAKRGTSYERVVLPLDRRIDADEIGQSVIRLAVTSIEDERFFDRWTGPIDAEALLRAAVQTFVWKKREGGSTILVQAAKRAQGKFRSSLGDKPYQFLMALRLSQRFPSDEEQLAFYLNLAQIDGPHGMAYAASSFYGVANLSELKTTEPRGISASAMLAGMLKSPTKYHPRRNPNQALERRNLVLRKMHEAGVFEDLAAMQALPLDVRESPRVTEFDFFARALRRTNNE
jgi:membrane peptidoglycan carboxypeptidase